MLRKYNIALIPTSKSAQVVQLAQRFSKLSDKYQLGQNSLPHVTLCQFESEEKQIDKLWQDTCVSLQEHSIELEFKDFSCVTFDNIVFWVSLMPNQRAILEKMHQMVAKIVNVTTNKVYDPHMTLISTKDVGYKEKAEEVCKSYIAFFDQFVLSIGECDAVGQLTKLLNKCDIKVMNNNKILLR